MIKIRWGVIAGTIALILSLAVGIVHGNNLFYVVTRAFLFMAVFFGLGLGSWILISSFIPELLYVDSPGSGEGEVPRPGSRIDITLDNTKGFALPEMYRNPDNPEEVGNIADLISGVINPAAAAPTSGSRAMDHNREDEYTYAGGSGAQSQSEYAEFGREAAGDDVLAFKEGQSVGVFSTKSAAFSPGFESGGELGGLPDLDAMAGAFLTNAGMDTGPVSSAMPVTATALTPPVTPVFSAESAVPERKSSGNKPQPLKGDFNPKELAEGIRTVLSKEP